MYVILSLVDYDFYIGCTCKTLKKRMNDHMSDSLRGNSKLFQKISALGRENLRTVELFAKKMTWDKER